MTQDIVERLRSQFHLTQGDGLNALLTTGDEAADLIEKLRAENERLQRLVEAVGKIIPIRVSDGPDYAEVYFSEGSSHSTQAMTMNPRDWIDVQTAYDFAAQQKEVG